MLQLKGFAKVRDLVPGSKEHVKVVSNKYAVLYWDEMRDTSSWTDENLQ
jgi:beta-glucosidase